MNRLKYPQKFLLISVVFSAPLVLMLYLLLTEIRTRIDFTQTELQGDRYLRALRQVWQFTLEEQVASQTSDRIYDRTSLVQSAKNLETIDQELTEKLQTADRFKAWQQAFQTQTDYSQIINQLNQLRSHIGDTSNLILDPDLDTYYMMDVSLLKLPDIQKNLAEVKFLAKNLKGAQLLPQQRLRLIELSALLSEKSENLARSINTSFKNNPKGNLQPNLSPIIKKFLEEINQLTKSLDRLQQVENQLLPATPDLTQAALATSFQLWDQSVNQLDVLLQNRIDGFVTKQQFIILFVAVVLLIVTYLFISFYRAVMQSVQGLSLAAQKMTNGSKGAIATVTLDTKDELGEVVTSFNQIAIALVEAIASARVSEAKYRQIFENSIEGIFQTTINGQYLIVNPALASIYGYTSPEALINAFSHIEQELYVNPHRRREFIDLIANHGKVMRFESEVYRQDRSTIWISENASALYDSNGNIIHYEGTVIDISDRIKAENDLSVANLEIKLLNERLKAENLRMSAELGVSRQLQQMILPKQDELEQILSLDIAGYMEPATEVGGDYYDVLMEGDRIKIGIGDVTGHGLESSVLMIMVQTVVRTLLIHNETDPVKFLHTLNRTIYGNVKRMKSSKNLTLALLDYKAGNLTLSGQHEELIIVRSNGDIERIDTIDLGFPIGLEDEITSFISQTEVKLEKDDLAVLYTDGVTEAENMTREQYGLDRLCAALKRNYQLSAQEIRQAVIADLRSHIGTQKIYDDITLLVLKQR